MVCLVVEIDTLEMKSFECMCCSHRDAVRRERVRRVELEEVDR